MIAGAVMVVGMFYFTSGLCSFVLPWRHNPHAGHHMLLGIMIIICGLYSRDLDFHYQLRKY